MSTFEKKLMVFVSSTYTDLLNERQAAVAAILKSGNIPAGMELFTAGDTSQLETIKRWIDQCDVYMLILGGRYGSIEPTSGVSYTELEYDYAKSQNKKVFAVVIAEDALEGKIKQYGSAVLEKDNPKQLKQFKEKVLRSISSFFSDEKDIKLCVHESLGEIAVDDNLSGWIPAKDFPDTNFLTEQLQTLEQENFKLKAQIDGLRKKIKPTSNEEFERLAKAMQETEVIVPESAAGGDANDDFKRDLLFLLTRTADRFLVGVTNAPGSTDYMRFLYFNLGPKLQVFGFVENEKVASAKYRRSYLTKRGQDFLLYLKLNGKDKPEMVIGEPLSKS